MSISKTRARKFAEHVLREHEIRSYRCIARDDFSSVRADGSRIVKAGTLNRIAKAGGDWIPKDPEILVALGLKKKPEPTVPAPAPSLEWWGRLEKKAVQVMVNKTKKSLKQW